MAGTDPSSADAGRASYFLGANAISTALGVVAVIVAARWLGAVEYGVLAVVLAVATLAASFVDLRVADLAGKLYYDAPSADAVSGAKEVAERRAGILVLAWAMATGTALAGAVLAVLLGPWVAAAVTSLHPPSALFAIAAAVTATQAISGTLLQLLRLVGGVRSIGLARVAGAAVNAFATWVLVSRDPTALATLSATLIGAMVSLVIAHASAVRIWRRREDLKMASPDIRWAIRAAYGQLSLLWYGNLMGYLKMVQRSLDVILVARMGGEAAAGIYKLARQAADQGLAVLQEAYHMAEHPRALKLAAARDGEGFRALACRVLVRSGIWIGAGVVLGICLLPRGVTVLFGPDFAPATPAVLLLALSGVYLVGMHPWTWAWVIVRNRMGSYTGWQTLAVAVQYAVALLLVAPIQGFLSAPGAAPVAMAAGALSGYALLTGLLLAAMKADTPGWLPGVRATAAGGQC